MRRVATTEEWNYAVFIGAVSFKVSLTMNDNSCVTLHYRDWPIAVTAASEARNDPLTYRSALIYAITASEQSVCLSTERWPLYQKLWEAKAAWREHEQRGREHAEAEGRLRTVAYEWE